MQNLARLIGAMPPALRRTITFDNGTEFAQDHQLARIGLDTFFCDPRAPWQKGGVENAVGRLRRYLPRRTDLSQITAEQLDVTLKAYNNTPRKCLDFKTLVEAISANSLHFECESTAPPNRG